VEEGIFLFQRGISPYDGGLFHQAPMFLIIFSILKSLPDIVISLLYVLLDIVGAHYLTKIARYKLLLQTQEDWKSKDEKDEYDETKPVDYLLDPNFIGLLYPFKYYRNFSYL